MSETLHDRLYDVIHRGVSDAVADLTSRGHTLNEAEITKKIVRYITKPACSLDPVGTPWMQVCEKLVDNAMSSFHAACSEREWFFDIQLVPTFTEVVWAVLIEHGADERLDKERVEHEVFMKCGDRLERALLDRAMWDATDEWQDHKVRHKVFHALSKAYFKALDVAIQDSGRRIPDGGGDPEQELQGVEMFTKNWIEDALSRCWSMTENAECIWSRDIVENLFTSLIAPFGKENPFSCIPSELTQKIGRPPLDWPFIPQVVKELFRQWNNRQRAMKGKRKALPQDLTPRGCEERSQRGSRSPRSRRERSSMTLPLRQMPPHPRRSASPKASEVGKPLAPAPLDIFSRIAADSICSDPFPSAGTRGQPVVVAGVAVKEEHVPDDDRMEDCQTETLEQAGHPRCTSEEECIGSASRKLVRHILHGIPGDAYCEACWESFKRRNPSLEGLIEEGVVN